MDDVVLTFHCAASEADVIAQCLRTKTNRPVHVRQEAVHGRDFSDARIGEQVTGMLSRAAVEILASRSEIEGLTSAVGAVRRAHPVRWVAVPAVAHGRIA